MEPTKLRIPKILLSDADKVAEAQGTTQADVLRQAMTFGLVRLRSSHFTRHGIGPERTYLRDTGKTGVDE